MFKKKDPIYFLGVLITILSLVSVSLLLSGRDPILIVLLIFVIGFGMILSGYKR